MQRPIMILLIYLRIIVVINRLSVIMDIGTRSVIMRQSYVEDFKDFLSQQTTKNAVLDRDLYLIFSLLLLKHISVGE